MNVKEITRQHLPDHDRINLFWAFGKPSEKSRDWNHTEIHGFESDEERHLWIHHISSETQHRGIRTTEDITGLRANKLMRIHSPALELSDEEMYVIQYLCGSSGSTLITRYGERIRKTSADEQTRNLRDKLIGGIDPAMREIHSKILSLRGGKDSDDYPEGWLAKPDVEFRLCNIPMTLKHKHPNTVFMSTVQERIYPLDTFIEVLKNFLSKNYDIDYLVTFEDFTLTSSESPNICIQQGDRYDSAEHTKTILTTCLKFQQEVK